MNKIRKFFKWLCSLFGTNTIVTIGNNNNTFVSQTTKVTTVLPKFPNHFDAEAMKRLSEINKEKERRIAEIVKNTSPAARSHSRNVQSSRTTSSNDDDTMAYVAMSSVYYSSSSSSDDGGSYSSGDFGSSSSSCD